jgi:transposase
MEITRIGLDTAKNVFQVHGVDRAERAVLRKKLRRDQVVAFFANLPPALIGLEACGGAHYWARKLQALGHTVKLIPPQYVKPYVKTNKSDAADAEAICEAVGRPNMRFAAINSADQQTVAMLHNARSGYMKRRTALVNEIRGELTEFGVVLPKGPDKLMQRLAEVIDEPDNELPVPARQVLRELHEELRHLRDKLDHYDRQIEQACRANAQCMRVRQIPGIGALSATAFIAKMGDAQNFRNARQVGAWMGLVPRQHSSGGKEVLLGISKHGDVYLRTLFIHGARSVIASVLRRDEPEARWRWLLDLIARRGANVAAVALANKNARTAWALLAHDRPYDAHYKRELQPQEAVA